MDRRKYSPPFLRFFFFFRFRLHFYGLLSRLTLRSPHRSRLSHLFHEEITGNDDCAARNNENKAEG